VALQFPSRVHQPIKALGDFVSVVSISPGQLELDRIIRTESPHKRPLSADLKVRLYR